MPRRLTTWLAVISLAASTMFGAALAARAEDSGGDPPTRVGRLSRLTGDVSSHGANAAHWTPAVLNFPFNSGDALWTQPQAGADIEIGDSLITLADQTEFDLDRLGDQALVASEPQGALFLDLRDLRPGETYTLQTSRGAVQIAADGEYEILAGDTGAPTEVAVVRGAAQLTSGDLALRAGPGQKVVVTGGQDEAGQPVAVQGDVEPLASYDPFLTAMLARNSVPLDTPALVQGMTGAEGLAQYGAWQDNPDYGEIWVPQVAPGWVPYRDGNWSYVAPWGWTWVDSEPWGFAPFHYGRWAQLGPRWCWVPGEPGVAPAYAPALVDFIAAGAVGGIAAGTIGWIPLGPREAYVPLHGGSPRYLHRLNPGSGWHRPKWDDDDHGGRRNDHRGFANRGALTIAPVAAIAASQPIRHVGHGIDSPQGHRFQQAAPVRALPSRPPAGSQPRASGPPIRAGHVALIPVLRPREQTGLVRAIGPRGAPLPRSVPAPPPVLAPHPAGLPPLRHVAPRAEMQARPMLPRIGPRVETPSPAYRTALPRRPALREPRVETPMREPQIERPHLQAPRFQAPRVQAPRFQGPAFQPRPMLQPHLAPARPIPAARPVGRPP